MTSEYFAPLDDKGFGIKGFNYDKFKQWLEGQQLNFRRTLAIQGDLLGNWDGGSPLDLSSIDTTATTGFAADASEGNVQFNGSVFAAGIALFDANNDNTQVGAIGGSNDELLINNVGSKNMRLQTLTGGDIKFQPGSGGRVTLNDGSTDLWTFRILSGTPRMEWRPADLTNLGFIQMGADNIGGGDIGTVEIQPPRDAGQASLILRNAASGDGGSYMVWTGTRFDVARLRLGDGTVGNPALGFQDDTDTGFYREGSDTIGITTNGALIARMTASITSFPGAYADTTGNAANAVLNAAALNGRFQRSTSAEKYKDKITKAPYLADIELVPTKHWRLDDKVWRYGLIADWLAEQDPLLGVYGDDGEIESYDDRMVIAVLAAKINRLEKLPSIKAQL